jgi:hypothetical protein
MRITVFIIIFCLFAGFLYSDDSSYIRSILNDLPPGMYEEYVALNDQETRYNEYKDSDEMLAVKLLELLYINKSRERYNVPPVKLDILASRVANRMSQEACEENFMGHWNTRGEKPYHRYAFAGGVDHVMENASAQWSSANFQNSYSTYSDFMEEAHDQFMAERAPYDGHKQNCIAPDHNYVGIGCYLLGNQFRYYEEFIDRYIEFIEVQHSASVNEDINLSVKPVNRDDYIFAVIVYYEDFPSPLTPSQINNKGSYPDYTSSNVASIWPWELDYNSRTGEYNIPLKFRNRGLYYVQIYLSEDEYTGGYASTEGKIQGSGLVIKIE